MYETKNVIKKLKAMKYARTPVKSVTVGND